MRLKFQKNIPNNENDVQGFKKNRNQTLRVTVVLHRQGRIQDFWKWGRMYKGMELILSHFFKNIP